MECQFSVFIACLLFTFLLFRVLRKRKSSSNLPPAPWKLPIIGNLHQLACSLPHRRLGELAKKYGPIMHLQLGEVSTIVISSPSIANDVLKTHDINFANRPFVFAASVLMYNSRDIAFSPYGDYWRQLRKICTLEILSVKRVKSFKWIRQQEASNLAENLASSAGSPINLSRMLSIFTFTVISRSAFANLGKRELAFIPLMQQILKALGGFSVADVFPSIKLLHIISGVEHKFRRLHQQADTILEEIIAEHRERRDKEKDVSNKETDDFVDVLLNLQDHGGDLQFPLTTESTKAIILDMFVAGTETSANVVEWAMSELLRHPGVMKKAQAEVRKVFYQKTSIDETSLHELNYLKLVIKETMRLHPPVPLLGPRENRQEAVELNGYEIPIKTHVIVNAWAMGRDPNYWTEAEKFIPERFLSKSVDYKGADMQFIPFGAGRRICPGMLMGEVTVELLLANLLLQFDWELPGGMAPEDLDMSEAFGIAIRRKNDLCLIPLQYHPQIGD